MTNKIYGVDLDSDFTPLEVRDAILACFKMAHSEILNQTLELGSFKKEEIEKLKEINIEVMIKGLFKKNGDDYDKPTKESLIKIIGELKEFSKNFRAEDVIDKHYTEIMMLINKLR